jgi:hypothetical protein
VSTTTEQDIKNLTPEHRIVWHAPPGQPVEMGLWVDVEGFLYTDVGHLVRHRNGDAMPSALRHTVRIIPPPFVPRVGMVIGKPGVDPQRLVRFEDATWLGRADDILEFGYWFTDTDARTLIENHGWEVMGDLAAPEEEADRD